MRTVGVICEFNPLHPGHTALLERCRGEGTVVCVMSGNFVQRGDFAVVRKHVRAEAALRSGADLVLELPTPYALASAEQFAWGGVFLLQATGVVDALCFGSECGQLPRLQRVAQSLPAVERGDELPRLLKQGLSYAAARERALQARIGEDAALLREPNNILGVEYLKAMARQHSTMEAETIQRQGPGHDQPAGAGGASAAAIRQLLRQGEDGAAWMAPEMAALYRQEAAAGRAPVQAENCQRAILAKLRSMESEQLQAYDGGGEGLYRRFYQAAQQAVSLEELLQQVKTRRYPYARLRRMALRAYLGLPTQLPPPPYLRVLGCGPRGRELLRQMKERAMLPILTKPADVSRLSPAAQRFFAAEARCTDLYVLAYPALAQACGGSEWTTGPVIL